MAAASWKERGVNQKKPSSAVRGATAAHRQQFTPGLGLGQDLPREGRPLHRVAAAVNQPPLLVHGAEAGRWLRERSPRGTGSRRPSGRGGRRWLPGSFPPPGTGGLCPRLGLPPTAPGRRRCPHTAAWPRLPPGCLGASLPKRDTPLTILPPAWTTDKLLSWTEPVIKRPFA